uniref:Uncharacterized protein n=1 Tax=Leersia perrieri TaxID=77586 RepID=A0A0D9WRA7_9ORYZ
MERSRSAYFSERRSKSTTTTAAGTGDLRCHSAYYVTSTYSAPPLPLPPLTMDDAGKAKKKKKAVAATWHSSSSASRGATGMWAGLGNPEIQRQRRVAGYRVYDVEGKVKVSLKSSMRWIKGKCTRVVDGWW